MFRIEGFSRIAQGIYRVILTTDDPGFLPALRLLRHVSAAADLLHQRIDRERRVLHLLEERQAAEPAAIAERARILATYRELPGSRCARVKQLRKILADRYGRCGYDDVLALISRGVAEERAFRRSRVKELAASGRSTREIGRMLNISPAQASRLSGAQRGDARGCPVIDDLPSTVYGGAAFPGRLSRAEENQGEPGVPEGAATPLFAGAAVRGR